MTTESQLTYPPWVVLHVPHDSTVVPDWVRPTLPLTDAELRQELDRMTDHLTLGIFVDPSSPQAFVRAPVSRLVVDVERFSDDREEPMAARGMGAVYTTTSQRAPLRTDLSDEHRTALMTAYYVPHHLRLEAAVSTALECHGRCLVIDCHSFPDRPLPYEAVNPGCERPDICIGTDDFHTGPVVADAFRLEFERSGWRVWLNRPFAGAVVPSSRYRTDRRVWAVMIEINRRLYLDEANAAPLAGFEAFAREVRECCKRAIAALETGRSPWR